MKNREKAKQIVDGIFESGFNTNRTFYDMALNSAMEMAEWKDTTHKVEMDRLYNAIEDYLPINVRQKIKRVFFNE